MRLDHLDRITAMGRGIGEESDRGALILDDRPRNARLRLRSIKITIHL